MNRIPASSLQATQALQLVSSLQQRFAQSLESTSTSLHCTQNFTAVEWFRDEGAHGGGIRFETADGPMIGRGSVNVSQVHYDDNPSKKLGSATAISTIIHPINPLSPSVHIHISWTEMKNGDGYWRMMADLNPAIENKDATIQFTHTMKATLSNQAAEAIKQGETYFYIPVLQRHRGASHFYLEEYRTSDKAADSNLAKTFGESAIDTYVQLLKHSLEQNAPITDSDKDKQLAYHTLYFFQVLTLDRGTTTGLLVHNQNDVGIMGSLPAYVDRNLLQSWVTKMPVPQNTLLQKLINTLPTTSPCLVDASAKQKLAQVVREHYHAYPDAIHMQATGHSIPPTVDNHQ